MKVHEIITESQILTENLSRILLNVLERVGVADLDKALALIARSVVGKTDVAVGKEMAEAWLAASKQTKLPFEDIVAAGQRELNTAGVNRTVVDAALAEAERIAPGLWSRIMSRLGKAGTKAEHEAAAKSIFGSKFDFVSALAYKLAIWGPVAECAYHLWDLKRRRDSGDPEYQNDATYKNDVQYFINKAVGQIATALVGNKLLTTAFSIPGSMPILGWKRLEKLWQGSNQVAQTALNAWLLTPGGRDMVSKFIASEIFGKIGDKTTLEFIRDQLGGWITDLYEYVEEKVQTVTNPAAAAQTAQRKQQKSAAELAAREKLPKYSTGTKYDQYGMPIQQADPRGEITPLN
jgi:hypothetical protein